MTAENTTEKKEWQIGGAKVTLEQDHLKWVVAFDGTESNKQNWQAVRNQDSLRASTIFHELRIAFDGQPDVTVESSQIAPKENTSQYRVLISAKPNSPLPDATTIEKTLNALAAKIKTVADIPERSEAPQHMLAKSTAAQSAQTARVLTRS